jgi:hypothetical protein
VNTYSHAQQQSTLSSILQTGFRQGATTYYGWGGYAVVNGSGNVPADYVSGGTHSAVLIGEYHMGRAISSTDAHAGAVGFDHGGQWDHLTEQQRTSAWALMHGYSSLVLPFRHGGYSSNRVVPTIVCIDPARFRILSAQAVDGGPMTVRARQPVTATTPVFGSAPPGFRPAEVRGYAATPEITFPALPSYKISTPTYSGAPMNPNVRPDRYVQTRQATMPSARSAAGQYGGPAPDPTPSLQAVLMPGYRE